MKEETTKEETIKEEIEGRFVLQDKNGYKVYKNFRSAFSAFLKKPSSMFSVDFNIHVENSIIHVGPFAIFHADSLSPGMFWLQKIGSIHDHVYTDMYLLSLGQLKNHPDLRCLFEANKNER